MIRPRFRKGTADVIWEGVLTDWEFSCPVVEAPNGIVEAVRPYITVSTNRSAIGCTELTFRQSRIAGYACLPLAPTEQSTVWNAPSCG